MLSVFLELLMMWKQSIALVVLSGLVICFVIPASHGEEGELRNLNYNDPCVTLKGKPGVCVKAVECLYTMKIFHNVNSTYEDSEYLYSLKCGSLKGAGKSAIPLFCCPKHENSPKCGATKFSIRIHGGETSIPGDHPWAALLMYDVGHNRILPKCGGSLITTRFVLTAAHCLIDRPKWKLLYVRFSEWDTKSTTNCTTLDDGEQACKQDYDVESWIAHPQYNKSLNSRPNDIAIIKLTTEVNITDYVRDICLPTTPEVQFLPIEGEDFTVTGWGETEETAASQFQQTVELPGLANDACNKVYAVANVSLTEKQMCVGGLQGKDSCRGDSGGPLLKEFGTTWYQVGVVSFGARYCATVNLPGVYSKVSSYMPWIESIIFEGQYL